MSKNPLDAKKIAYGGTGLVALLFFVCTLFLLLYGFSAYIIRSQIDLSTASTGNTAQNNNSFDVNAATNLDKLIHTIEKNHRIESEIADTNRKLYDIEFNYSLAKSEMTSNTLTITQSNISVANNISNSIQEIQRTLRTTEYQLNERQIKDILQEVNKEDAAGRVLFVNTREHLSLFKHKLDNNSENIATFEEASKKIDEAFEAIATYEDTYFSLREVNKDKDYEAKKLELNKKHEEDRLRKLLSTQNDISKTLPPESEFVFSSLNLLGGTLLFFVKLPTIVLTLIVTIAAGGLASLVSFTRKFLHKKNSKQVGVGTLLSNVAEGVAASIGIFLFAGTGMLMLTQGGANAPTNVELSPYMVAFLAFLSGFMAESAFKRIEDAGRDFFKTKKDPDDGDPGNQGPTVQI